VDAIVAGIGIAPNLDLAKAAGLEVEDGVVVDDHLRTSKPDVYAAGDVARFTAPALGVRMRVEHEDNALTMGKATGRAMAGDTTPYAHLPFFYSDLFELGYEAVGEMDPRGELLSDWKVPFREGVVYYLSGGRVRGVLLWNTWEQVDAARALIAEPGPYRATIWWTAPGLSDPDRPPSIGPMGYTRYPARPPLNSVPPGLRHHRALVSDPRLRALDPRYTDRPRGSPAGVLLPDDVRDRAGRRDELL
jgi:hypothetical protein